MEATKINKKWQIESKEKGVIESIMDKGIENDVLRMRIKELEKSNERTVCSQNKEINDLKAEAEEQNIKVGHQADKIHQLNTANIKKDLQIEQMEKRLKELSSERDKLEREISEMKVIIKTSTEEKESQNGKIQKLESELADVKKELKLIWEEKEKQEKMFESCMNRKHEELKKMIKETMKEGMAEILSKMEHKKESSDSSGGLNFHIEEVNHVQFAVNSEKATNIVEQTPRPVTKRQVLAPSKLNMQFST